MEINTIFIGLIILVVIIILAIVLFTNSNQIQSSTIIKPLITYNPYNTKTTSILPTPTPTPILPLYKFIEHRFTNANITGRFGPTLENVKIEYKDISWAQNINFLNMISQGIQVWTVPFTGNYRILAAGASGASTANIAGQGAILQVTIGLKIGEKIKILVGQAGNRNSWGGGGGGGTFVIKDIETPIIIAGGGGGCDYNNSGSQNQTINASVNTSGQSGGIGESKNPGSGGQNGNGGKNGNGDGAGGGFFTNGEGPKGGQSFKNGGAGGVGSTGDGGEGGFGGGGGASGYSGGGGGGGGYSGGGSGGSYGGGGGGGSFSYTGTFDKTIAFNRGNGYVVITAI